jgi:lysozyme
MALSNRERVLLALLGGAGVLYVLAQTSAGQRVTGSLADKIAALIAGHEGDKLIVYQDIGGLWTVGKGHLITAADTVIREGTAQKLHPFGPVMQITQAESDAFFERDTATARNAVANRVSVPLSDNQRAALVSLVFNIGAGAFGGSTLLKKLNAGDYTGAADQFLVWKKVAGVDSQGLMNRRASERDLFLS